MAVVHSPKNEQSFYDIALLREDEEWNVLPEPLGWLVGDGMQYEVKADEMAFTTGNLFYESGRTDGTKTGIFITQAQRWIHGLGRGAIVCDPQALRDHCPKLAGWGHAKLLRGGDRDGTQGYAVPALAMLQDPFVTAGPTYAYQIDIADKDISLLTGLKTADKSMDWRRDRNYGERAEAHFGNIIRQLPLLDTSIIEITEAVKIRRLAASKGFEYVLEAEFRREGTLSGIAAAKGYWLVCLPGVQVLLPVASLKALARKHFARSHRIDPTTSRETVRIPLAQALFCAGPDLPQTAMTFNVASV